MPIINSINWQTIVLSHSMLLLIELLMVVNSKNITTPRARYGVDAPNAD
jgi:hypothetical protein